MKLKLHLTLLLFFLFIFSSKAQYYYTNGLLCFDCATSIEAGAVLSDLNGLESSPRTGIYLGLSNIKEFNDNFALKWGISYSNEGAKPKDYNTSLILHTFNIPVSGHYIYKRKYQAFLGGEIGMIMASKDPTNKENDEMMLFGDNIDFFDYRVFIGGGVFLTKSKNVALNLKYNLGLSNISTVEGVKWKRNALTLSLEYTFGYD